MEKPVKLTAYTIPDGVELRPHSIARVIRRMGKTTLVRFEVQQSAPGLEVRELHQKQSPDHIEDCDK